MAAPWRILLLALAGGAMAAGGGVGTVPKATPAAYQAQAACENTVVAADFHYGLVHGARGSFLLRHYLVVEAAVLGPHERRGTVGMGGFTLHVNGRKNGILPQPAHTAAYYQKAYDNQREAIIMAGEGAIVIGRDTHGERFPGDPVPGRTRRPPQVPQDGRGQAPAPREEDLAELLNERALPEGEVRLPVSGYLYFPFEGKVKSIKRVELRRQCGSAEAVLRLK